LRGTPGATLCPCTTLCRSRGLQVPAHGRADAVAVQRLGDPEGAGDLAYPHGGAIGERAGTGALAGGAAGCGTGALPRTGLASPADRKSTRLNSSHVKISYA